mmetsp:Transcript_130762/g.226254  ORF Transcript_130762/g.226254 Transcript_130762/m.226254 type:complete len:94 (+) Transcript_130762:677-958(+)
MQTHFAELAWTLRPVTRDIKPFSQIVGMTDSMDPQKWPSKNPKSAHTHTHARLCKYTDGCGSSSHTKSQDFAVVGLVHSGRTENTHLHACACT